MLDCWHQHDHGIGDCTLAVAPGVWGGPTIRRAIPREADNKYRVVVCPVYVLSGIVQKIRGFRVSDE